MIDKLTEIRKQQKITCKSMASKLNVTPLTLRRYELDQRPIPFCIIVKYADILGYELKFMLK